MDVVRLQLPEVLLIRPRVYHDERGFFLEVWNRRAFQDAGIETDFVQLNHSASVRDTLRGLHFQYRRPQSKLVRVLSGRVYDVAVDLRPGSVTFGRWAGTELSAEANELLWIPEGFAHGFCVLSERAEFEYLCGDFYDAEDEGAVIWNDPEIGIPWPVERPLISGKDAAAPRLSEVRPRLLES